MAGSVSMVGGWNHLEASMHLILTAGWGQCRAVGWYIPSAGSLHGSWASSQHVSFRADRRLTW